MLAEAVDIRRWLREDRSTPFPQRLERDRAIGRELSEREPVARVLGWWRRIGSDGDADGFGDSATASRVGRRVEGARRLACAALAIFGLLLGAAVAGVALAYDGRYPVNLFTLLGVLVGLPLVMLLLTLLLLPGRVPGLGALQSVAAGMNIGRWIGAWLDRLLGAQLFAPEVFAAAGASAFSRWQLVVFSQWLALGFFAGALSVAMLSVTFSDLAFGWSTTLEMDPALVHGWVSALSAPWRHWLPVAAPDLSLVEASRYYRLEHGGMAVERAARLGGWWPFVLLTILVYGALPRLLLMLVAAWRLRRATAGLLTGDPEVTALLDRLDAPLVALRGNSEEERLDPARESLPAPREAPSAEGLLLMIWNGAAESEAAARWLADALGVRAEVLLEVGILQPEADQRDALAASRRQLGSVKRILVLTKGWEPPLLEFMDFLGLVREELGADSSITVVPLALAGASVEAADRDVWARALARVRDPRLYVMEAQG